MAPVSSTRLGDEAGFPEASGPDDGEKGTMSSGSVVSASQSMVVKDGDDDAGKAREDTDEVEAVFEELAGACDCRNRMTSSNRALSP